jgi:hypothetical protein
MANRSLSVFVTAALLTLELPDIVPDTSLPEVPALPACAPVLLVPVAVPL